jgi:hypothetical protein
MTASPHQHPDLRSSSRRDELSPERGSPDPNRDARPRARARAGRARLFVLAAAIVVLTWLPGYLGSSIGPRFLHGWGVFAGYIGLSWVIPALLVGLAAAGGWRDRGFPLHRLVGIVVGVSAGLAFLLAAAQIVGG